MRISDLYKCGCRVKIDPKLDTEKELRIEKDMAKTDENSIFFYYRGAKEGSKSPTLNFQGKNPYAIVCESTTDNCIDGIALITVQNVRKCMSICRSIENNMDYSKLKVIGITGTNGKTSTAEMLFQILRRAGKKVGFIGTGLIKIDNNILTDSYYSMTTPDPDLLYPTLNKMSVQGCEYVVMEVSSHAIALSKVAPIQFECCIFTNLSKEHTDFHKSMDEYYKTKLSLFEQTKIGIFNLDDEYSKRAYFEAKCKKYSIGVLERADGYIIDFQSNGLVGSSYFYKDENLIFKTNLMIGGIFNVYNALMATKCALLLGIPACIIKQALENITNISGRFETIRDDVTVVIDYAHTPLALENLLQSLNSYKTESQNVHLVFGCGGNRDTEKREIMGKLGDMYADRIILTEDNSRNENTREIITAIKRGIKNESKCTVIENRAEAIRHAILTASHSDIIAIVGKGHEKYIIDCDGIHPFDEKEIIKATLSERNKNNAYKA